MGAFIWPWGTLGCQIQAMEQHVDATRSEGLQSPASSGTLPRELFLQSHFGHSTKFEAHPCLPPARGLDWHGPSQLMAARIVQVIKVTRHRSLAFFTLLVFLSHLWICGDVLGCIIYLPCRARLLASEPLVPYASTDHCLEALQVPTGG